SPGKAPALVRFPLPGGVSLDVVQDDVGDPVFPGGETFLVFCEVQRLRVPLEGQRGFRQDMHDRGVLQLREPAFQQVKLVEEEERVEDQNCPMSHLMSGLNARRSRAISCGARVTCHWANASWSAPPYFFSASAYVASCSTVSSRE